MCTTRQHSNDLCGRFVGNQESKYYSISDSDNGETSNTRQNVYRESRQTDIRSLVGAAASRIFPRIPSLGVSSQHVTPCSGSVSPFSCLSSPENICLACSALLGILEKESLILFSQFFTLLLAMVNGLELWQALFEVCTNLLFVLLLCCFLAFAMAVIIKCEEMRWKVLSSKLSIPFLPRLSVASIDAAMANGVAVMAAQG
jgi:hypothetical protein